MSSSRFPGRAGGRRIGETPFAAGMLSGYSHDPEPFAAADRLHRLLDLGPFGHHDFALDGADVVEIDVDREARHVEDKEVERRPSFERDAGSEKRVAPQGIE